MARDWDAASYDRVSGPMETMGAAVLDRLPLRGDETVLDAGCGSGRVTALLLERLPRGRVIAVDASPAMVAQARKRLGERVRVIQADLTELTLDQPVYAILSTATFHWIPARDRLFARLFAALRPGGRLVAQAGGSGNIAGVLAAADDVAAEDRFAPAFAGWSRPSHFLQPGETADQLTRAGFTDVRCWLEPRPAVPDDPRGYLRTIVLRQHVARLPEAERDDFVRAVAGRLGNPVTVDYVRLNLDARRP